MANLTESPIYEPGIFQLEKSTPPLGGAPVIDNGVPSAGHANAQGLQLANRTAYLKQAVEANGSAVSLASDLKDNIDSNKGATLIGYDGGVVSDALDSLKPINNYNDLRGYVGTANRVQVTATNISGIFKKRARVSGDAEITGITILSVDGVSAWDRDFTGPALLDWFLPVPYPADSSAAFNSAYSLGIPVYVSEGSWFSISIRLDLLFGPGLVYSNNTSFGDSGLRPINKSLTSSGGEIERVFTYGNFERAAGKSLLINDPSGRAQVSGYTSDSAMASYINRDHVGYYIGMCGPKNQLKTTAATTNFTANTVTSPDIVQSAAVKIGMFINTGHSPKYSARITGIDYAAHTLTVSGWFQNGNTAAGQIPANGFFALINAADKIWGQNTNVFINSESSAKTATGYELGVLSDGSQSTPVWGFNAVNLNGTATQFDAGFVVTGKWNYGYTADSNVSYGLRHVSPGVSGLYVENTSNASWAGACVLMNNTYPAVSAVTFLGIKNGAASVWTIDGRGHRSSQREALSVVSVTTNVSPQTPGILVGNNAANIIITPSGTFYPGHVFEVKPFGTGNITFGTAVVAAGAYAKFVFDGSSWLKLI